MREGVPTIGAEEQRREKIPSGPDAAASRPGCRMDWLIGRIAGLQVLERWGNLTAVTRRGHRLTVPNPA